MNALLFDDLHEEPGLAAQRQANLERGKCVDEVFKHPGITSNEVAQRVGIGLETAKRHLVESKRVGDVRQHFDQWLPGED